MIQKIVKKYDPEQKNVTYDACIFLKIRNCKLKILLTIVAFFVISSVPTNNGIPTFVPRIRSGLVGMTQVKIAHASFAGVSTPSTSSGQLSRGLVGWWTFDGKNMISNVTDSSGQGNHGDMINFTSTSTAVVPGKIGQGIKTDGTSYVNISDSSSLGITSAITLSSWIKTNVGVIAKGVIDKGSPAGSDYDAMIYFSGGASPNISFYMKNSLAGADVTGSVSFNYADNKWHLYSATFDGDWMYLYIDGVKVASKDTTLTNIRDSGNPIQIGRGFGSTFPGQFDDVRIYSRALSAKEVQQLYNEGAAAKIGTSPSTSSGQLSRGLVGWWTFDGKNMISNVTDSSGQGNHGDMIGFTSTSTAVVPGKVGQGVRFDGVNQYVKGTVPELYRQAKTISAWIKIPNNTLTNNIFSIGTTLSASAPQTLFQVNLLGRLSVYGLFNSSTAAYLASIQTIPINTWTFVTFTDDGLNAIKSFRLYINGNEVTSYTASGTWEDYQDNTNNGFIGVGFNNNYFNGLIDDVRIYNRALSAGEVQQLYQMGR